MQWTVVLQSHTHTHEKTHYQTARAGLLLFFRLQRCGIYTWSWFKDILSPVEKRGMCRLNSHEFEVIASPKKAKITWMQISINQKLSSNDFLHVFKALLLFICHSFLLRFIFSAKALTWRWCGTATRRRFPLAGLRKGNDSLTSHQEVRDVQPFCRRATARVFLRNQSQKCFFFLFYFCHDEILMLFHVCALRLNLQCKVLETFKCFCTNCKYLSEAFWK